MVLTVLTRIISVLLLAVLAGCGTVQTGYNNAPVLLNWWLDGYLDFDDAQSRAMRTRLDGLHAWHRRQELPAYADLLQGAQQRASGSVSAEQVCGVLDQARVHMRRLCVQSAQILADLAPTLQPAQLRHLAREFEKSNRSWRAEWLEGSADELLERRVDRAVKRYEDFYGRLTEAQRALLRQRLAESGYDARLAWAERQRRQQDILQVLQEHRGGDRPAHTQAEMLALVQRSLEPPDPVMRSGYERLIREGCDTIAALHESASPAQRRRVVERLRDYEVIMRRLAAAG